MLVDALLQVISRRGRQLAVDDGLRPLTYRKLGLLAAGLHDLIRASTNADKIGVMLPASSIFPATLLGGWWAKKIVVPLNFLLSGEELSQIVQDAGLDTVLTISHFDELSKKLPANCMALDKVPLKRRVFWRILCGRPDVPTVKPDDTAVLLYTSGTTAEPKGVELTYANLHSNCVDSMLSLQLDSDQKFLNVLPPFHVFGLTTCVLLPALLGATVYAIPRFNPAMAVRCVRDCGVTIMMAIPSMYAAISRVKSATPENFASLNLVVSGGEPLPDSVRSMYSGKLGIELCEGYGLTETSPVVCCNSLEANKVGSVGKPILNVQCQTVDKDGAKLSEGEDGELWVKGPGVMKRYYNKPDQTRAVLTEDGWFRTGDMARIDEEGFIHITGRIKEMLIIGGENVYPREIETVLEMHEAVEQSAVIGVEDASRGEAAMAFVTLREGADATELELRSFVREHLAGFKVPKKVYVKEDLPKSPTGKILKRKLYELL